jgi:PilZ domain
MTTKTKSPPAETAPTRRWQRFRFDVPVQVVLEREARKLAFPGRGTGMNEGGIGLDVEAPLQPGEQVQLEFTPPYAGLKVLVRGLVRHADGNRCGIEFLTADEGEREELALFRRMLRAAADRLGE